MSKRPMSRLAALPEHWDMHWQGMPEFVQEDLKPWKTISVNFLNEGDLLKFSRIVGQNIPVGSTRQTQTIWFPKVEIDKYVDKCWVTDKVVNPRHPVYIISKGRWESRLTSKALEVMNVPYHIVVEPQEYNDYAKVIDPSKILVLPFSNLGQGSIPARNWVWEHSMRNGATWHWILDDNIEGFFRLNRNLKVPVRTGAVFRAAEDFVERYENIALAGFNYFMFASRKTKMPPFYFGTRIYSCILVRNETEYMWRGRYNEDTDLSLRVLKDGWCTVLFNAFLAYKKTTMTMKGGNTDELYRQDHGFDGRLAMAESIKEQHPDVAKVTRKWHRWQHHVNYSDFMKYEGGASKTVYEGEINDPNIPVFKQGLAVKLGINNYGMRLVGVNKYIFGGANEKDYTS